MKKTVSFAVTVCFLSALLCGCGEKDAITVSVFSRQTEEIISGAAEKYETDTGIHINIASENTDADIFEVSGVAGLEGIKGRCCDLSDSDACKSLASPGFALSDGKKVCAVPTGISCYAVAYSKKHIRYPEGITSFDDLLVTAEELDKEKQDSGLDFVFAPMPDDPYFLCGLLSLPIYGELSENDDYDSPLFAALNARQIAFRYSDEAKAFFDLLKGYSPGISDTETAYSYLNSGKSAFMIISSENAALLKNRGDIGILPVSFENDGSTAVLAGGKGFLAVNKNAPAKNIKAAKDFIDFLFRYGKPSFTDPFKEKTDDPDIIKITARNITDGDIKIIPVLSSAFPEDFCEPAGNAVKNYISGAVGWEETVNSLKELWKTERN